MRSADFAYQGWYPYDNKTCRREIEGFQKKAKKISIEHIKKKGGIVPHAGWFFSGVLAFSVLYNLIGDHKTDTIIMVGKHSNQEEYSSRRNTIMLSGEWETPFGPLNIDEEIAGLINDKHGLQVETEEDYEFDNTVELQLPFIKYLCPETKIVPLGVVERSKKSLKIGETIGDIIKRSDKSIKIIGTTDMTHYGPGYGFTPQGYGENAVRWVTDVNDKRMIDLFLGLKADDILEESSRNYNCCCPVAVATALTALRALGVHKGYLVDYYTSYSVRPSSDFVGYAGVIY
ncbi:MAG: AmmeMemoRadiSam system protein B [Candidatus Thermoplasmatota archaeon]